MSTLHTQLPDTHAEPQRLADVLASAETAGLLSVPARLAEARITGVEADSRRVQPGALFAAIASDGDGPDGHDYVDAAFEAGAIAALVSPAYAETRTDARLVATTDTRAAVAEAATTFWGRPGDSMSLVGITGTNGKTTTSFLLHGLLTRLGKTAGLVGTIENRIGEARYATAYTTPEAPDLQRLLRAMADGGVTHAALEVSSHGLALDRTRGVSFDVAVFTNLTQDHLDFHPSFEAYAEAKKSLFDGLRASGTAIVNADDPQAGEMVRDTPARVVTFGTAPNAAVRVEVLDNTLDGLRLRLDGDERDYQMLGRFNALNLAAAYAVALALGFSREETLDALAEAPGVPGRFETVRVSDSRILGVVDYAHTPDALDNVLATAREVVPEGNQLWVVFGCGGDRDAGKRPLMAQAAEARADRVIVTSDNPRTEAPAAILADIATGLARPGDANQILDREAAIRFAAQNARPGDVIVVAGKGHEPYQILGTTKHDFDDRLVLAQALTDVRTEALAQSLTEALSTTTASGRATL